MTVSLGTQGADELFFFLLSLARLPECATYQCILFTFNRLPYLLCTTHLLLAVQMRHFENLGFRPLMSDLQHPLSYCIAHIQ